MIVKMNKFNCPIKECEIRFTRRLELRNHLIYDHNSIDLVSKCPICKEKFSSLKELKSHEKNHGEFKCNECGQKFLEKSYLDLHEKKHDSKREIFECEYCKKRFFYKGNLNVHIKNKHLNETFKCFLCDKELSTNQKLKQHINKKHKFNEEFSEISLTCLEDFSDSEIDIIDMDKKNNDKHLDSNNTEDQVNDFIFISQEDLDMLQQNFFN